MKLPGRPATYNVAMRTWVVLLLLSLALPAWGQVLVPGDHTRSLVHDGITRTYLVHVPPSYTGVPVPLVVDMHGFTSTNAQQRVISGFLGLSNTRGFIAAWPQGIGNAWNAGICCGGATADDVGFIRALVAKMEEEAAIDRRRIYATGLSNGGAMTHRLACEAADIFAAAAPFAFPISISPTSNCVPSRKIPVLTFMGLTDALVPYNGGGSFPSAAATFEHWRSVDECGAEPPELHTVSGASFCDTDTSCGDGLQVGLCSITSTSGPPYAGHILYLNPDYNVSVLAYDFLSQFSLAAAGPALPGGWTALLAVALALTAARGMLR